MAASNQNILVLGATGHSGLAFIKEALSDASKPHLTLLVRTLSKLPAEHSSNSQITIVEGQLDDYNAVSKAVKGTTAVVSFLGPYITLYGFLSRSRATPIADAFPTLFAAMRDAGVKRIMALSTPGGFRLPEDKVNWTWWLLVYIMPDFIIPAGSAEMGKIGRLVAEQADLDWTVFRIPHLNDGSAELKVETGYLGSGYGGSMELSRPSLARWVLRELGEGAWVGKCPAIGNPG